MKVDQETQLKLAKVLGMPLYLPRKDWPPEHEKLFKAVMKVLKEMKPQTCEVWSDYWM